MELPIEAFSEAVDAFVALAAGIEPDRWDGPGLGDWDLRALVGHASRSLITVETYLDRPATRAELAGAADYYRAVADVGIEPAAVLERGRAAGAAMGADPAAFVDTLARRVVGQVRQLADDGADPVIESIVGGIALSDYLPTRTFELVVHGFDIAAAIGAAPTGPNPPYAGAAALREATALASEIAVLRGDGRGLLLALTGRGPLPPDFSVV